MCDKGKAGEKDKVDVFVLKTTTKLGESSNNDLQGVEPHDGMEFDNIDNARVFYATYAKIVGFCISTVKSKFKDGQCIFKHLGCWKNGDARRKPSATVRRYSPKVGCKASVKVKLDKESGKYTFCQVVIEHNHELSPLAVSDLGSHRSICTPKKAKIKNTCNARISTSNIVPCNAKRKGGICQSQFTNKKHQSQLKTEDVQKMIHHFLQMQLKNPTFFYVLDLNETEQLCNAFWIDRRSRMACSFFSDVITLDTTYLASTYQMPFTPFVGVNHHGQFVLLGCALLSNKKAESFIWVFKSWLEANGGKTPKAIITDQNKAIEVAVADVFPNARHRFCLWHILKKIPEKIGHICTRYPDFMDEFDNCIYDSVTRHEFEERWGQLIAKYWECKDNDWLKELYESRTKWAPVFLKDTFFAGMSTSQRNESVNHFFDGFVQTNTTLGEFIEKYLVALERRYNAEDLADLKSVETTAILQTPSPFEKQAASIYTRDMFKKFQQEVVEIVGCLPTILHHDEKSLTMRVKSFERFKVNGVEKEIAKEFTVSCDRTEEVVTCDCRSFEFGGYLCRHALMTLQFAGIFNVPRKYFMKRWTTDMRYSHAIDECNGQNSSSDSALGRYNILIHHLMKVAEVGSLSKVAYNLVIEEIPKLIKKLIDAAEANEGQQSCVQNHIVVNDPPKSLRKERKSETRIPSSIENVMKCRTMKASPVGNKACESTIQTHVPQSHLGDYIVQCTQPNPAFNPLLHKYSHSLCSPSNSRSHEV